MEGLDKLIALADRVPRRILIFVNGGLALMVAVAQGFALLISALTPRSVFEQIPLEIRKAAIVAVPVALVVIVAAILALLRPAIEKVVLRVQTLLFVIGAAALLAWATHIAIVGFAPNASASWTAGMLTMVCCYVTYLARRALPGDPPFRGFRQYAHLFVIPLVAPIDAAFGYRVLMHIQRFLQH